MQTKLFELRDRATFVPVIATLMQSDDVAEDYLLRRSGFFLDEPLIIVGALVENPTMTCSYEPYSWGSNRTRHVAHCYIIEHWHELPTGSVIDVEFILGETPTPKQSERLRYENQG